MKPYPITARKPIEKTISAIREALNTGYAPDDYDMEAILRDALSYLQEYMADTIRVWNTLEDICNKAEEKFEELKGIKH